jgi:hypothetical protein
MNVLEEESRRREYRRRVAKRRRGIVRAGGGFNPLMVPELSGWLRLAAGTIVSSAWSSIPDIKAGGAAVQGTAAQRPAASTQANGLPIATFDRTAPNQLSLPLRSAYNGTTRWGFACWIKLPTLPGGTKYLMSFGGATGRYDNAKVELAFDTTSRKVNVAFFGQDTTGYNGRQYTSANTTIPVASTAFFFRAQFDGSLGTEVLRHKAFVNEVDLTSGGAYSNIGTGGTPVALRPDAESVPIIIGNYTDNTDTSISLNAVLGGNAYFFTGSPSAANGAKLMGYDPLT